MHHATTLKMPSRILAALMALVLATSMAVFPGASIATAAEQPAASLASTTKIGVLTDRLTDRFSAPSANDIKALGNDYTVVALALAAQGKASSIDVKSLKALYSKQSSAGALGKIILGLTAAGANCQAVSINGKTVDLVKEMESKIDENTGLYDFVWVLPVYAKYPDAANVADQAIKGILGTQVSDDENAKGLFDGGWGADTQTTAQAVCALSLFKDRDGVDSAIEAAIAGIKRYQDSNGGFYYDHQEWTTSPSVDATGTIAAAFLAYGIDPDEVQTDGASALDYLQANADSNLKGYTNTAPYNEPLTSATAFLGLAGIDSYAKTGTGNVYQLALSGKFKLGESPVSISTASKTYTGKAITPLTSVAGLTKNTDYTVSCKNNIKVGTATVTLKGKGKFTGTITKTFTIKPKGTSIKGLTRKDNALGVSIKKRTEQVSGYQIAYSTSKSFKTYKTKTIKKDTTTKTTLSKLKNKKTYYVKARTYTSVKGKKIYSSWSSPKHAKTL